MRHAQLFIFAALIGTAVAACDNKNGNPNNPTDGGTNPSDGASTDNQGGGTCAMPIDLAARGMVSGADTVFHGTTTGMMNVLHPYGGCAATDAEEAVFSYHVPENVQALRLTTAGSGFNTVLYVRATCDQVKMGTDLTCNDDSRDAPPQSTVYLTNFEAGRDVFIVVDGTRDPMNPDAPPSDGEYTLTVTPVTLGTMGNPCRPLEDGSTAPRCDGGLACSDGGGADGTSLCVPPVAVNAMCDPSGFSNACPTGSACVSDPTPEMNMEPIPMCRMPGTAAGAVCRMDEPRCDGALQCGAGKYPICVRVLAAGAECDLMGMSNVCPLGQTCRAVGDAGGANCSQ